MKAVISQNTDGLHRRSGIAKSRKKIDCLTAERDSSTHAHDLDLFELHGNSNLEKCSKCRREYLRDFRTRSAGVKVHDHKTGLDPLPNPTLHSLMKLLKGRLCDDPKCRGTLRDSIVNFGENLPDGIYVIVIEST